MMKRNAFLLPFATLVFGAILGTVFVTSGAAATVYATITCATTTPCETGSNTAGGPGIEGISARGHGVIGTTNFASTNNTNGFSAVFGEDLSTSGVFDMGVQGISVRGYGVRGKSTSNVGVRGDSASSYGVQATSTSGYGIYSTTTSGIGVYGSSTDYLGVYGVGQTYGLYGSGSAGYGVVGVGSIGAYGSGTNYGMYAVSSTGKGITASSGSGQAVYAQSSSSRAFEGHTNSGAAGLYVTNASGNGGDITGSYIGLVARSSTFPLLLTDANGNDLFYVDGSGNLFYHGALGHFSSPNGAASTAQSATSTTQESGTGRLVFGQANVALSADFARSIDWRRGYQVIITPNADTRGLYVVSKTPYAFAVREMQSGRGNMNFDYVVYATTSIQTSAPTMQRPAPRAPLIAPAQVPSVAAPRAPAAPHEHP